MIIWSKLTSIEKNAKVAEEVMGYRIHIEPRGNGTEYDLAIVVGDKFVNRIEAMPDYVASLDAAWEIVEHISATRKCASVYMEYSRGYAKVVIMVYPDDNLDKMVNRFWAESKTVSEAICVAALLMAGVEMEGRVSDGVCTTTFPAF